MTRGALIVLARYPRPGEAKTRLIPALGAAGAARLQDAMTRHTLGQATLLRAQMGVEVEVRYTPEPADAMRQRYGGGWGYVPQGPGDLGARLSRAAEAALAKRDGPVVLIGTDCPDLTTDVLAQAFDALAHHDAVLGPAHDGGYYLIGMRRFLSQLFDRIDWSTSRVLAQTRAAAEAAGASYCLLAPLADVDCAEDLPAAAAKLAHTEPAAFRPARLAMSGATGLLGGAFLRHALDTLPDVRVTALVRSSSLSSATPAFRRLLDEHGSRITLVHADLCRLRLSDADRRALTDTDGGLYHFAASTALHAASASDRDMIHAVNDGGTAQLLDLLSHSDRPGPFYHLSTAYVCGRGSGGGGSGDGGRGGGGSVTVFEHELRAAASFHNDYERSKHAAETRVRAALSGGLRGAIFRPSLVVSESMGRTPGSLLGLLAGAIEAASRNGHQFTLRVPPGAGINAVPMDWVARALMALAPFYPCNRTYHLTAPQAQRIESFVAAARAADVHVRLAAEPDPRGFRGLDRYVDRMMRPFRPYFDADVEFDRLNLELDAPALGDGTIPDIPTLLRLTRFVGP